MPWSCDSHYFVSPQNCMIFADSHQVSISRCYCVIGELLRNGFILHLMLHDTESNHMPATSDGDIESDSLYVRYLKQLTSISSTLET